MEDHLKEILTETERQDLLKEVQDFEKRRNEEDEFERRKGKSLHFASRITLFMVGCWKYGKGYTCAEVVVVGEGGLSDLHKMSHIL